jgi:hypothetical protein
LHKASSDRNPEHLKDSLDPQTLDWLFDRVLEQIACLAAPQDFFRTATESEAALLPEDAGRPTGNSDSREDAIDWYADRRRLRDLILRVVAQAEPLIGSRTLGNREIRFELLVDGFANRRKARPIQGAETALDQLAIQVADLRYWRDALEELVGNADEAHIVAGHLGILPEGIRWEPVRDALERAGRLLENAPDPAQAQSGPTDSVLDLVRDLGAYLQAIETRRDLFDQGMRAASVVALAIDGESFAARRLAALAFLDRTLPAERDPKMLEMHLRMPPNDRREWTATAIGTLLQRPRNIDKMSMVVWCDVLRTIAVETEAAAAKLDSRFWETLDLRYWTQWSWDSRGPRVNRAKKANLLDLVFAARHDGFRLLEPDAITPRLGLWSLLLFRLLRDERNVPAAVMARVRRDLGLDRALEEPALVVVSKTNETLSWRVSGKVPALSIHFEQDATTGLTRLFPSASVIARALAAPAGQGDGDRPVRDESDRPWMLAIDTALLTPTDTGLLISALGSHISYVTFGPDRTRRPDGRPHLPSPESLETLYPFALSGGRSETA